MKYVNQLGIYRLNAIPRSNFELNLSGIITFLLLILSTTVATSQCSQPPVIPTCDGSIPAIPVSPSINLNTIACDGIDSFTRTVQSGESFEVNMVDGKTYSFELCTTGSTNPDFSGVMDLTFLQTGLATTGTIGASPDCVTMSYTDAGVPNPVKLSIWDKNCAGSWLDYDLKITCTECELTCPATQIIAANEDGCVSAAASFAMPTFTGPCDNIAISDDGGSGATISQGLVMIPAETPADIYDIEFIGISCTGDFTFCTTRVVVEPTAGCNSPNVTLSNFCETSITASLMLEPMCTAEHQYTVYINGQIASSVNAPGTYTVAVHYTPTVDGSATGALDTTNPFFNKQMCWQNITVEDKSGPACNLAQADLEYNFVCGFESDTAVPTFTDCSGTATANPVQEMSIGICGDIDGITDGDNDLFNDFAATGFINFMGMSIPAPSEAIADSLSDNSFALERIIKKTFSATDGQNTGASCDQFIYIWRPTVIVPASRALITCGLEITPTALAAIDPKLVPHYANPLFGADTNLANDFSDANIQDPSFTSTKVDDAGNPEFVAIAGQDHTVCGFIVTNEDGTESNPCGNTTKLIRRYTVLNCCTNEILLDNVSQYIETIDNVSPVFSNCPTGTASGTITNPVVEDITESNTCLKTIDFSALRPTATDDCSEPITYNASFFELADDFTGAGTFVTSGMMPSLEKGSYRVEVTATDECGNISAVCDIYLRVEDKVVPTVTCSINAVSVDGNGNAQVCASNFSTANDNCGIISNLEVRLMEQDTTTFADCININCADAVLDTVGNMVFNLVFRATDACGNTNISMCPAQLQVKTTPQFTCPPDVDVECTELSSLDGDINGVGPTVGGTCGQMFTTRFEDADQVAGVCTGSGTISRTYFLVMNGVDLTSCTQTINIVDNTAPVFGTITTPLAVECDAIPDGSEVVAVDSCPQGTAATVTFTDSRMDGSCTDEFTITRTFTATDDCGNSVTATQTINVSDNTMPEFSITPANITVACSNVPVANPIAATDNCGSDVTVTVSDSDPVANGCPNDNSFIRTFTATDNCGNTNIITQMIDVQAVPIIVSAAPNLTLDCSEMDNFTFTPPTVTDSPCESTNPVITGPVIENGAVMPDGSQMVTGTFTVTDDCGISFSAVTTVTFTNCCPTVSIQRDLIICSAVSGSVTIDPFTTYDGDINDLTFRLVDGNGNQIGVDQVGNDVFTFTPAAIDGTEYITQVFFTDPILNATCPGAETEPVACSNSRIAGRVFNEEFVSIEDVEVELMNTEIPMSMTDIDGEYIFEELTEAEYTVTAHKENDPANGINSYDLVIMTQHVLGINELSTPYKLIAADINMDQTINIIDMLELRQLILFAIDDFTVNDSWRFIDADYVFPDPQNPWIEAIPSARTMELGDEDLEVDFIAVKIGDLDCSAQTKSNFNALADRSEETLVLNAQGNVVKAGSDFEVALSPSADVNLSAAQFTIDFDPSLADFNGISSETLGLNENSINKKYTQEGLVPFVWYTHVDQTFATTSEMVLSFTAKKDLTIAELFQIDSELTPAFAYSSEGEQYDVQLNIQETSTVGANQSVVLHQNQPNPFLTNTTIGFEVSNAQQVSLTVFDIDGKLLYTRDITASKGYNSIELTSDEIAQRGVMFYQLNTADYSVTKKMIILE